MSPLESLGFLEGRWHAEAADQFGEQGVIESNFECSRDLGDGSLIIRGESRNAGRPVNSSIQFIVYDAARGKFIRKALYSYGFINNEEGAWDGDTLLFDVVTIDNEPASFRGVRWRSFIRRYGDDEIGLGLLAAKPGEDFVPYGETRARRAVS